MRKKKNMQQEQKSLEGTGEWIKNPFKKISQTTVITHLAHM